uniref:zinc finger and SCAN domain-containing protein 12-like n=1 Tax=Euleptes europaea TaxID=460621 RepID=UPI002541C746|nr:zinc finger and SCAN domain-containing protein 12-like [Euleptes europaea]
MRMEEQEHLRPIFRRGLEKSPHVLQVGYVKDFLQRRPGERIKQEPGEGSLQQWEVQWQEFLRSVDSPWSQRTVPPLPEKPSPWEDAKAFLASFEQVAEACRWPKEEWVTQLLPALSGDAEQAFISMGARDREDYGKVKAVILRGDAISREKIRQHFRHFCYQESDGPRGTYSQLQELCHRWLRVENHSKEQILELLILEQLLSVLPQEIQSQVRESGPESCSQAVALAEEFLLRQREPKRQEQQVLLEKASGSVSEAGHDPSESKQRQFCMETKQEDDPDRSLLAKAWMSRSDEETYMPDSSELVRPCGTLTWTVKQDASQEIYPVEEAEEGRNTPRDTPAQPGIDANFSAEKLLGRKCAPCLRI